MPSDCKDDVNFVRDMERVEWNTVHLVGWSDGGSRDEEGCSSSAWILKALGEEGRVQVIAAGAKYYNKVADSSLEVECKVMRYLWEAIAHVEKDHHFVFVTGPHLIGDFSPPKRRRLRAILVQSLIT